jgi:hypothetical protein
MRTWGYLLYIAYIRWIQRASSVVDWTCGTKKRLASSILLHGRKTAQVCNQENKRRPSRISGPANAVTILFHRKLHLQVIVAFIRVLYRTSSIAHYCPRIQIEILSTLRETKFSDRNWLVAIPWDWYFCRNTSCGERSLFEKRSQLSSTGEKHWLCITRYNIVPKLKCQHH